MMKRHENTYMQLEELGTHYPPYQPTFEFEPSFISPYHAYLANCPRKNDWLIQVRPE